MRLMIVGDLGGQLIAASKIATKNGARVFHVSDNKAALHALRGGKGADLIMIDVNCDIKSLVQNVKSERIHVPVVACGIESDKEKAVAAIKAGAKEYVPLPPEEELIAAVLEAISGEDESSSVIYKSDKFTEVIKTAKQIAPTEASVLITGESGTGKEVMARFIHKNSKRKSGDLISVNCAAIPENLLESELFGHEKGAFTGAIDRRIGKFEEANGSTLLLDEISEMDLKLQAKLLRAIQEKEIVRVGGNQPVKLDIRIIATTNRNLLEEVKAGTFREDLFYRLNVINLTLPCLRDRQDDIVELSNHFIKKYAALNGVEEKKISSGATTKLVNYRWPGNVRELENTIHRSLLLANDNEISEEELLMTESYFEEEKAVANSDVGRTLESVERDTIKSTLTHCLGDHSKTANILGISIRALRNKLKQYQL